MKAAASLLFILILLLSGCSAVSTRVDKDRHFAGVRHFFVLSNLNDNHGIDDSIVRALQARGFEAEAGPFTMMPDAAQVLITYEDRWAWDFSNHMVHLQIAAQDPQAVHPYATAVYHKNVALSTRVDDVVTQLVGNLLKSAK
ncbi:MAG TPA: hypothetical protein VL357_09025 [Rariglobus sp.]|jgi:hypothetical protein|nr:hypothetical protein [Rariglobus sp.]